jgi:alpha-L-rhamnosidase
MLANGATTLWERWERRTGGGMNSHNHPMLGSVGAWLYRWLAGIRLDPQGPGYARFRVQPHFPEELNYARATLETLCGRVEAGWERGPAGITVRVKVPVGSQARVSVPRLAGAPAFEIRESEAPLWRAGRLVGEVDGITDAWEEGAYVTFSVGSGIYSFFSYSGKKKKDAGL